MKGQRNPDRQIVKVTLLIAGIMTILGGPAMSPALPSIRDHFSNVQNIEYLARFVLTLPALMIAGTALIAGYLVDRIGRLTVLSVSLALAGLAGTSGYFAQSIIWILVGRALLGIGVAGIMTSGTALIADYYTGAERGRLLGLQTGLMGLGGTILLMLIGVLADRQWNTPFLIHLSALIILPFVLAYIFEPVREERCESDHPPVGEPGSCAGEAAAQEGVGQKVGLAETPIKLLLFIYLLLIFIQINFYIVPLYLPFYLGELLGASATQSAGAIATLSLSYSLSSIFLGKAMARHDRITVLTWAFAVLGFGYSLISLGAATALLYVGLVIAGTGLGILIPSLYVWVANETPAHIRGRALGGFTTAIFLGQFLSPVASQPLIEAFSVGQTMLIAGGVFFLIVPLLFLGRGRLRRLGTQV